MDTRSSRFDAGFAAHTFSAAGVALVCLVALPPAHAQDGGACEPRHDEEQPAAGHWTGTYRLAYELVIPKMPSGMPVRVGWEGELSFDLGRTEADDPPATLPPLPRRRPLGVKPPAPSFPPRLFVDCCNEAQAAAILAAERQREAANEAKVQEILQWYASNLPPQHLYVPPGSNAVIKGVAQCRNQTTFGGAVRGGAMRFDGQGTAPVPYDVKAEETDPRVGFTEIELLGTLAQMDISASSSATGQGARMRGSVTVDRDGMRGHTELRGPGGSLRVDHSGANPTPPGEKTKFASLTIESRKCWEVRGAVDESTLRQLYQSTGVSIRGVESEWTATLDERDEAWEEQVDRLAAEPLPAEPTWEYVDSFTDRWFALRGIGGLMMSDYKRCVLKKLEEKFIRINVAALRVYLTNFPRVDEGATCGVMRAALQRMWPILRRLQLYGMGDCPLLEQAWKVAEHEMQLLVRQTLARRYTMRDLECFIGVYQNGLLDFGDQAAAFGEALDAMVQAAANAR